VRLCRGELKSGESAVAGALARSGPGPSPLKVIDFFEHRAELKHVARAHQAQKGPGDAYKTG
jgi:hypothetical protein